LSIRKITRFCTAQSIYLLLDPFDLTTQSEHARAGASEPKRPPTQATGRPQATTNWSTAIVISNPESWPTGVMPAAQGQQ